MGDGSPKTLVNLGDVVLIDLGDGVFTGRDPGYLKQTMTNSISLSQAQYALQNTALTEFEQHCLRLLCTMQSGTAYRFNDAIGTKSFNASCGRTARKLAETLGIKKEQIGNYWVHLLVSFDNDLGRDDLGHNIWLMHESWLNALHKKN